MEKLANTIYNNTLDMDFLDYEDTKIEDLKSLLEDLQLLEKQGNGSLLNAIKILMEN